MCIRDSYCFRLNCHSFGSPVCGDACDWHSRACPCAAVAVQTPLSGCIAGLCCAVGAAYQHLHLSDFQYFIVLGMRCFAGVSAAHAVAKRRTGSVACLKSLRGSWCLGRFGSGHRRQCPNNDFGRDYRHLFGAFCLLAHAKRRLVEISYFHFYSVLLCQGFAGNSGCGNHWHCHRRVSGSIGARMPIADANRVFFSTGLCFF